MRGVFLNTYFEGEWDLTTGLRSFAGRRRTCHKNSVAESHVRGAHAPRLAALPSEYDYVRTQILSSLEVSSF